jgi:hypothetical protein
MLEFVDPRVGFAGPNILKYLIDRVRTCFGNPSQVLADHDDLYNCPS